jgi:hypothetical protein
VKKLVTSRWFYGAVGLVLGALVILGIRVATYAPAKVHYHANFAVYLNGQQFQFKGPQYYEEEGAVCAQNTAKTPKERAHMHDNINSVVHVEDNAVTWGDFFNTLGWSVGQNFVQTDDGTMYQESGDSKLHVVINGQDYTDLGSIASRVIKDQDKLLLSFGDESSAMIMQQYRSVPATARHYDVTPDPETCSGSSGPTMHDRMAHMF